MTTPASLAAVSRAIPRSVWLLGLVSMLMDISSEMIQTLLPLYLVTGLGASAITIGLIEGFAVATAMVTRLFAGVLSDWSGRRKPLILAGYGLAALSRPIVPLADTAGWIASARFLDRIGKGIRSAPRDALIADVTPPELRGASFGLRKSLDTVGGFVGPLVAIGLMLLSGNNFVTVFWIAAVPALIAVAVIAIGIEEPETPATGKRGERPRLATLAQLDPAVWVVIGLCAVLTFARFSEAFLLLKAQQAGFALAWVPLIMVLMHLVYGLTAYPVGILSDRMGRHGMLAASLVFLIAADLVLAFAQTPGPLIAGIALWGLHMGFSQGILATLIADRAPAAARGTAFGALNLATGLSVLIGNVVAGVLWEHYGAAATFLNGAAFAALALVGFLIAAKRGR
ncbi:MFS transporter [Bosea sp. LjRoot90]|uniref:MFS transporter n=1 Tax=Bosea sp. LjRoot90 TaxID=3342342 RepID=UPI003ECEB79C